MKSRSTDRPNPRGRGPQGPLARVRVFATGGTIAGAPTGRPGTRYRSAVLSVDALIEGVPSLALLANIEAEQVARVGSQDMTEAIWIKLASRIRVALARADIAGVVVTHGTDTLEETAFFLNLVIHSPKPVVLTGAMRPANSDAPDGPTNLFNAVAVASRPEASGRGVLVVIQDEIHFAREVRKAHTTKNGAFHSGDRELAGTVTAGRARFYGRPARRHTTHSEFSIAARMKFPRVEILYGYVGSGPDLVKAAVRAGARGLVFAGVGNGNLAGPALAAAAAAVRAGVVIVRASRTGAGRVERNVEVDDDRLGFIVADELSPQKARILLMLGLIQTQDPLALQKLFLTH